jgi:hypothetical protein
LYRLTNGDWALPIIDDDEDIYPIPCEGQKYIERLSFAQPGPREHFDPNSDWGKERIAKAKYVRVRSETIYLQKGISLKSIRRTLDSVVPDFSDYSCAE